MATYCSGMTVETGDVAGIAIEDFESHFLKKYPKFADGWVALKPEGKRGFHKTPWLTDAAALDYARRLKDMAYQGTLTPGWPFEDLDSIAVKRNDAEAPSSLTLSQREREPTGGGGGNS